MNLNVRTDCDATPLLMARQLGKYDTIELLIEHGAEDAGVDISEKEMEKFKV